ncbi:SUMF1/EgtB/PvdO family nonheme iron enzyme [Aquimonas voraii]|uniref:Formylglycine-generating enzyme, required for sulfatase activity, contains SUMF1/FGE domain n=1 Tax=Aquimonas voraii TaxID=265719 RepID=A0A1G6YBG1_9GAMM|nr:SUMF1/EgtB/PvdO family nonheme iron enzyme [Aquimonas voraii]SDD87333.1 Formylglycine-generating enzyme, required for sulfatase activity, contains SUMF1/FGE domain [Aquimonas voraii]
MVQAVEIEGYRIEDAGAASQGVQLLRARQLVNDSPVLLQLWDGPVQPAQQAIRQLAVLRHPGLATVLDVGETVDGRAYAALAVADGQSLRQRLAQGLDLGDSLSLMRRLALILRFMESRCPLPPVLDPAEVFADAQGRPLLTRLLPPSTGSTSPRPLQRLLALGFEALTGRPPVAAELRLPEYLARWQPLFDLDPSAAGVGEFLAVLDQLEGKPAAAPPPAAPPAVQTPAPPQARKPVLAEAKLPPAPKSAPAPPASAPRPRPPTAAAPAAAATQGADVHADERRTAPSRRLEALAGPADPARPSMHEAAPPPPSRIPLLLAAGLALPLLGGLLWWGLARTPSPPAPVARVQQAVPPSPVSSARLAERPLEAEASGSALGFQPPDPDADWIPTSPVDLDLAALPTVEDPLERLLLLARTNLQAGRLVAPPGRNALDRYLQALRIETENRAVQQGIAELAALCLRQAVDAQDFDPKLVALDCVDRVAAAHPAAAGVQQEASRYRQAEHDRAVLSGREALAAWRGREAIEQFERAKRLRPESREAQAGLSEATALGRPGYRFRDALQAGGHGPEMVVLKGLAWGVSEVRINEFEAYWEAAGRARFGTELPACRDRESLLRSSRKRDWRDPDFPQAPDHPVACVSFAMAQHYAEWLSTASGQSYRLPSLAEWRSVAAAPPTDCGANLRDQTAARVWNARDAAACSDGQAYTSPVGAAGEHSGLLGLWGNVAEWLVDCAGGNCRQRLAAGGSWFSSSTDLEPRGFAAEPAFTTIGIRVVRDIPPRE